MDKLSFQGGVAILLGMLHAKETGVSSGSSGPLPYLYVSAVGCDCTIWVCGRLGYKSNAFASIITGDPLVYIGVAHRQGQTQRIKAT